MVGFSFQARHIKELEQYFINGPLVAYGYKTTRGYLKAEVNVATPEKVNESTIDEIYQVIDEHYQQRSISDIPVVFMWNEGETILDEAIVEDIPSPDEGDIAVINDDGSVTTYTAREAYLDKDGNLAIRESNTTKQSPGFTSVMLILSIFLLAWRKKR